jgi:hypothetical protein
LTTPFAACLTKATKMAGSTASHSRCTPGREEGNRSAPRSFCDRNVSLANVPAILHGKRSSRPRSRAVQRRAAAGLLSEAFKLASTSGCATGLRTRSRHVCVFIIRVFTV